jgi:hypothetical protein
MIRYHFGLGVGHLYARQASTGLGKPASEYLHSVDVSNPELGEDDSDDNIASGLGGVTNDNDDAVSGSEHSMDLSDDDLDDDSWEEDGSDNEELGKMAEMYGLHNIIMD